MSPTDGQQASALIRAAIEVNRTSIGELLRAEGWRRLDDSVTEHTATGVQVRVGATSTKVLFPCDAVDEPLAEISLPLTTTYGVVVDVAVALAQWAERTRQDQAVPAAGREGVIPS